MAGEGGSIRGLETQANTHMHTQSRGKNTGTSVCHLFRHAGERRHCVCVCVRTMPTQWPQAVMWLAWYTWVCRCDWFTGRPAGQKDKKGTRRLKGKGNFRFRIFAKFSLFRTLLSKITENDANFREKGEENSAQINKFWSLSLLHKDSPCHYFMIEGDNFCENILMAWDFGTFLHKIFVFA